MANANYSAVATDPTPSMSKHGGKPPRKKFWARDLTIRHERFHSDERSKFGKAGAAQAQARLSAQTAGSLPDIGYEGPNLDLPSPPPDLPYERFEDWRSAELLAADGIAGAGAGVGSGRPRGGGGGVRARRARRAYRQASASGGARSPARPVPEPVLAAGYLAQLGDRSGLPAVREGLASELLAVRMLTCTQLSFFLRSPDADARGLLERALVDPQPAVRRQARAQLSD